jgi:lipopolysaccharide heptosyltransferase II
MQRILILRFSSLGDVVLLGALVEELRARGPKDEIWLATKPDYAALFEDDTRLDRVLRLSPESGGLRQMLRELRSREFDLILDAHGSLRSRLVCLGLSGTPVRRIAKDTAARLLFLRTRVATPPLARHQVDRYLALAEAEGKQLRPTLQLRDTDHAATNAILGDDESPYLAIAPGSRHRTKQWPLERFTEVAAHWQREGHGEIVLVGSAQERTLCEQLASSLPRGARICAGELELRPLAALLSRCRVLLCNDSGLMHLSEAAGTPVLAVFGPTSRELGYFPLDPRSRVVENELLCRPCSRNGARPCHMEQEYCLLLSDADRVIRILEENWT